MKIKILKDKWSGMKKLFENRESRQFSESWYIRNISPMNELNEIAGYKYLIWRRHYE